MGSSCSNIPDTFRYLDGIALPVPRNHIRFLPISASRAASSQCKSYLLTFRSSADDGECGGDGGGDEEGEKDEEEEEEEEEEDEEEEDVLFGAKEDESAAGHAVNANDLILSAFRRLERSRADPLMLLWKVATSCSTVGSGGSSSPLILRGMMWYFRSGMQRTMEINPRPIEPVVSSSAVGETELEDAADDKGGSECVGSTCSSAIASSEAGSDTREDEEEDGEAVPSSLTDSFAKIWGHTSLSLLQYLVAAIKEDAGMQPPWPAAKWTMLEVGIGIVGAEGGAATSPLVIISTLAEEIPVSQA